MHRAMDQLLMLDAGALQRPLELSDPLRRATEIRGRDETKTRRPNGMTARSYQLFGGATLPSQSVARFSAKRLRAFFDATLADVDARRDEVAGIFAADESE
jgi:hypothetical protein